MKHSSQAPHHARRRRAPPSRTPEGARDIASYIREIGRGKDGARPLDAVQAHDLMSRVLDRSVSDLEIGAFALAMRIKGELVEELVSFLAATAERCLRCTRRARRWCCLHTTARASCPT